MKLTAIPPPIFYHNFLLLGILEYCFMVSFLLRKIFRENLNEAILFFEIDVSY